MPTYTLVPDAITTGNPNWTNQNGLGPTALEVDEAYPAVDTNDHIKIAAIASSNSFICSLSNLPALAGGEVITGATLQAHGFGSGAAFQVSLCTNTSGTPVLSAATIGPGSSPGIYYSSATIVPASASVVNAYAVKVASAANAPCRINAFSLVVTTVINAPVNSTPPALANTPSVQKKGGTLTGNNGTWTNSPSSFTYRWFRNGVAIAGATASTYLVVEADRGTTITKGVTAVNGGGSSAESVSNGVDIVAERQNTWMMI